MNSTIIAIIETINGILGAGIAITAFSLFLYALTFNLRNRVARTFALILTCVVIIFGAEALGNAANSLSLKAFWIYLHWIGIILLPSTYLHFSDSLLETTGRPSRGRRRTAVIVAYIAALVFLIILLSNQFFGDPITDTNQPLGFFGEWAIWLFTLYYSTIMVFSWINFWRASKRTVTSSSTRRMKYLIAGGFAVGLGSFPFLLFGSGFVERIPFVFWILVTIANLLVSVMLVVMAYAVAFFGVSWPDRIIKRRLAKWLLRGPFTASFVLGGITLIRRAGIAYDFPTGTLTPIFMVITFVILEHIITFTSPLWERWLFHAGDSKEIEQIQMLEERLLTKNDLRQFLEEIVVSVADRFQTPTAFINAFGVNGGDLFITSDPEIKIEEEMIQVVSQGSGIEKYFVWGDFYLFPLYNHDQQKTLIGLIGVIKEGDFEFADEQIEAIGILSDRASLALIDRARQEEVFSSVSELTPQIDLIQRLRAMGRFDRNLTMMPISDLVDNGDFSKYVKDALSHYWGGPRLTKSPLMKLEVVQQALKEHDYNPTNALRSILQKAMERTRPEGERRFTAEWILYNILELKFMQGRKVRDIAYRLALSEADLYRKQRVAIQSVAETIINMEKDTLDKADSDVSEVSSNNEPDGNEPA